MSLIIAGVTIPFTSDLTVDSRANGITHVDTVVVGHLAEWQRQATGSISGGGSLPMGDSLLLTSNIDGKNAANVGYYWQTDISGSFLDISGANSSTYTVDWADDGEVNHRLKVRNCDGISGCLNFYTNSVLVTNATGAG